MVGLQTGGGSAGSDLQKLLQVLGDPEEMQKKLVELAGAEERAKQELEELDRRRQEIQAAQGQLAKDTALFEESKGETQALFDERQQALNRQAERLAGVEAREAAVEEAERRVAEKTAALQELEARLARALAGPGG